MNDVRLYINGQEADISGVKFPVDYALMDITRGVFGRGYSSKTITLKGTKTNKVIFSNIENFNSLDGFKNQTKPEACIKINGTIILKGYMKFVETSINDKTVYKINIFGNNGDWIKKLESSNINELDYSEHNHIYSTTNIINSWSSYSVYSYPLINYGRLYSQDYLQTENFKPALNISYLIDKIFNNIGYKVVSSFKTNILDRLFMPFVNDKLLNDPDKKDGYVFGRYLTSSLTESIYTDEVQRMFGIYSPEYGKVLEFRDNLSGFGAGGTYWNDTYPYFYYEVQYKSKQKFRLEFSAKVNSLYDVNLELQICRLLNNQITVIANKDITIDSLTYQRFTLETEWYTFYEGESIFVKVKAYNDSDHNTSIAIEGGSTGTRFYSEISDECQASLLIDFQYNLPDLKQIDLIKFLKNKFNLIFDTDVNERIVYFEPFDDFYDTEIEDWSNKVDLNKERSLSIISDNYNKLINFRDKPDDKDKYVSKWEQANSKHYSETIQDTGNQFVKAEDQIIESGFSPTLMGTFPQVGINSQIPIMFNSDGNIDNPAPFSTDFNFRILYYEGLTNCPEYAIIAGGQHTQYPYFSYYNHNTDNETSLRFDDTPRQNGSFQKYFRNWFNLIKNSRIFKCYINLSIADIGSLDFSKKKYIQIDGDGAYFYLQKINNYDPSQKDSVLCEFIRALNTIAVAPVTSTAEEPNLLPSEFTPEIYDLPVIYDNDNGSILIGNNDLQVNYDMMYIVSGGIYEPLLMEVDRRLTNCVIKK